MSPSKSVPRKKPEWYVLIYKVPSAPSRVRVAVWRELKRLGALYLQQAACILPVRQETTVGIAKARKRIATLGGTSFYFEVPAVDPDQKADLIGRFRDLSSKDYAEIVEECETKFTKEIEFERFRQNFTYEEAEEIRQDLEKLQVWFRRVTARDWFKATGRDEVQAWLEKCENLLEEFEHEVYEKTGGADPKSG